MAWGEETDEDALAIADSEIEELDNDEINANEAGFLKGYFDEESGD